MATVTSQEKRQEPGLPGSPWEWKETGKVSHTSYSYKSRHCDNRNHRHGNPHLSPHRGRGPDSRSKRDGDWDDDVESLDTFPAVHRGRLVDSPLARLSLKRGSESECTCPVLPNLGRATSGLTSRPSSVDAMPALVPSPSAK